MLLLVLVGAIYFLFFYEKDAKKDTSPQQNQEKTNQGGVPESQEKNEQESVEIATTTTSSFKEKTSFTEMDVRNLTTSFVERFGSYSNHSQFSNLKDLQMFMTEDMRNWVEGYIEEQEQKEYSGKYYGINTRVVSCDVQTFNKEAGEAEIMVSTQRTESKGQKSQENVFNQDIKVDLVKVNGEWKVDRAEWQ